MAEPARKPRIDDPNFLRAVELIDAGATEELRALLESHPTLLSARAEESGEFAGDYFAAPYLLWFTAENPVRKGSLPNNIVDVVGVLADLARRQAADSLAAQLDYTLALVSSGRVARECGQQGPMIQALIDQGASPDAGLGPALSHQEIAAARTLIECGAKVDLGAAAALGLIDRIGELFAVATRSERSSALVVAALNGQPSAVTVLVQNGVDPNAYNPAGFHAHATPLHNAVSAGHRDVVRALIALGADPTIPDKLFGADARGWAKHCGQTEILRLLDDRLSAGGPDAAGQTPHST